MFRAILIIIITLSTVPAKAQDLPNGRRAKAAVCYSIADIFKEFSTQNRIAKWRAISSEMQDIMQKTQPMFANTVRPESQESFRAIIEPYIFRFGKLLENGQLNAAIDVLDSCIQELGLDNNVDDSEDNTSDPSPYSGHVSSPYDKYYRY